MAFTFRIVASCHKSGSSSKTWWQYGIILAFCDVIGGLVCLVVFCFSLTVGPFLFFYPLFTLFFFCFFFLPPVYMQESISQAAAFLLCHPGLCPVWGHGSLLFDGGIPYPLCHVTTSGVAAVSITLSSVVWVCFHQSVPDWQLKKRFL